MVVSERHRSAMLEQLVRKSLDFQNNYPTRLGSRTQQKTSQPVAPSIAPPVAPPVAPATMFSELISESPDRDRDRRKRRRDVEEPLQGPPPLGDAPRRGDPFHYMFDLKRVKGVRSAAGWVLLCFSAPTASSAS
jgi:hypothetical protein